MRSASDDGITLLERRAGGRGWVSGWVWDEVVEGGKQSLYLSIISSAFFAFL